MVQLIEFDEQLIGDGYEYTIGVSAVDLTCNGYPDLVSTDTGVGLYWYENTGTGNFIKHVIHKKENEWLERHAIADINNDGKPEIINIDNINGSVLWFEYDGDPRKADSWSYHYVCEGTLPGAYDVAVADFDQDGELEIIAASWIKGNRFDYFDRKDGEWCQTTLDDDELRDTRMVRAVDMNGNGKPDLVGTATKSDLLLWYENTGDPFTNTWIRHIIDKPISPHHGEAVSFTASRNPDILIATRGSDDGTGSEISWYENLGNDNWEKHIIIEPFPLASVAIAADIDGDGQLEVLATGWGEKGNLSLFKHRGNPRGKWDQQIIKSDWSKAAQVIALDMDLNGKLDIVACAERGSNELRLWRNISP